MRFARPSSTHLGVIAALTIALSSGTSLAQPSASDRETARDLMAEGDKKLAAKDVKGAHAAFEEAHRLMNVPTTGIEVSRTAEMLGMLVEARDTCLLVTKINRVPSEPPVFEAARKECAAIAQAIAPRIATLRLQVDGVKPGTKITVIIDGAATTIGNTSLARRVNPGKRLVLVSADGYGESSGEAVLGEGGSMELKIHLSPVGGPAPGSPVQATPASSTSPAQAGPEASPPTTVQANARVPAYVAYGASGLGLVVGTVFGLRTLSKKSDRDALCPAGRCTTQAGLDRDGEARSSAIVSTIGFGVGIAGAAVGTYLLLRPKTATTSASTFAWPDVGPGRAGLSAGGTF